MEKTVKTLILYETICTQWEIIQEYEPVELEFVNGELMKDYADVIRVNYN